MLRTSADALFSRRDTDSTLNQFIRITACALRSEKAAGHLIAALRRCRKYCHWRCCALLSLLAAPSAAQRVAVSDTGATGADRQALTRCPESVRRPAASAADVQAPYRPTRQPYTSRRMRRRRRHHPLPFRPMEHAAYPAPPLTSPAAVGPPPAFDPYASGGSVAPRRRRLFAVQRHSAAACAAYSATARAAVSNGAPIH